MSTTKKQSISNLQTDMQPKMIPVGYMAKVVNENPIWLDADQIIDIYSVSGCISENFDNYINYWKHNGFWLFDSPEIIHDLAADHQIDISKTRMFFYEAYKLQYDEHKKEWEVIYPEESFETNVISPNKKQLEGYDVVSFSCGTTPECSLLSCNAKAKELEVNRHCLFDTLEEAIASIEIGAFENCEPGPYRIFAVYTLKKA